MRKQVLVRVVERDRLQPLWWVTLASGGPDLPVPADAVPAGVRPHTEWVARVDDDGARVVVLALLWPLDVSADVADGEAADRPGGRRRADRPPAERQPGSPATRPGLVVRPGDVVLAYLRFSASPSAGPDAALVGKERPAVVVARRPPRVLLRALYRTDGYQARAGAPPLTDWHAAGLAKPSVVGDDVEAVDEADVVHRLGRLTDRDRMAFGIGGG